MSDTLRTALLFLVNSLFDLYLFVLVIRVVLVWVRSDYFNPVTQFVVKLTDVAVKPLRRMIPNSGNVETASLFLIFVLEIAKYFLIALMSFGVPNLLGLPVLALGDTVYLIIQTFTYAIVLQAIISIVQPNAPILSVLSRFTAPILRPLQRLVPTVGGFDITPIPALIGLQLLSILLVSPLMSLGQGIALG